MLMSKNFGEKLFQGEREGKMKTLFAGKGK